MASARLAAGPRSSPGDRRHALLFISLLLYGSGSATNLQSRYAAGDLADPARRGRAIRIVLVATTLGTVIGPNLVEPTGVLADALGLRELAG